MLKSLTTAATFTGRTEKATLLSKLGSHIMFLKKKEEQTCSAQGGGGGACGGGTETAAAPEVETEATKLSKKQLLKKVRSCSSSLHVRGIFSFVSCGLFIMF
eukprot:sb/3478314/